MGSPSKRPTQPTPTSTPVPKPSKEELLESFKTAPSVIPKPTTPAVASNPFSIGNIWGALATPAEINAQSALSMFHGVPFDVARDMVEGTTDNLNRWMPSPVQGLNNGEYQVLLDRQKAEAEKGSPLNLVEFNEVVDKSHQYPKFVEGTYELAFDPLNTLPTKIPLPKGKSLPTLLGGIDYAHHLFPPSTVANPGKSAVKAVVKEWQGQAEKDAMAMRLVKELNAGKIPTPNVPSLKSIINKIKEAPIVRKEQEKLYSQERAERWKNIKMKIDTEFDDPGLKSPELIEKYIKEELRGELPKAAWEPVEVTVQVTAKEKDELVRFIKLKSKDDLDFFKNNEAFVRIMGGLEVPQPAQIDRLKNIFGDEFMDTILGAQPKTGKQWWHDRWRNTIEVIGIPRALVASFDLSAAGRQGRTFMGSFPDEWVSSFKAMHEVAFSERNALLLEGVIKAHPKFKVAQEAGLFYAERAGKKGVPLKVGQREEQFVSGFLQKYVPGLKMSERAYASFLNKYRHDIFNRTLAEWEVAGHSASDADLKNLAKLINYGTGRGAVGNMGWLADVASALFFAPRFATSGPSFILHGATTAVRETASALLPDAARNAPLPNWAGGSTIGNVMGLDNINRNMMVSKMWAKSMVGYVRTGNMWLEKLHLMGADVELNPRSSDFGKGKIGEHRFDFWGGDLSWVRYIGMALSGEKKSLATGRIYDIDISEVLGRFIRSKESPAGAFATDALTGEDFLGRSVDEDQYKSWKFWVDRLTPMLAGDIQEAAEVDRSESLVGMLTGNPVAVGGLISSVYGVGFQSFETSADIKNDLSYSLYGKLFDELDPLEDATKRNNINLHPVMREYYDQLREESPKKNPQDAWFDGMEGYNNAKELILNGEPSTGRVGAIQQVLNSPEGIARRDAIRQYKDSMYLAWQFNVTPQADAWHLKIATENLNPSEQQLALMRDKYWSVNAPAIVLKGATLNEFDFKQQETDRQKVLAEAFDLGVIPPDSSGQMNTGSLEYNFITASRPQVSQFETDENLIKFYTMIDEYNRDMDFLSSNYFNIPSDLMDRLNLSDEWQNYRYSNSKADFRNKESLFYKPELDQALKDSNMYQRLARSQGWDEEGTRAMINNGMPIDIEKGREISRLLLKYGYLTIGDLPKALADELMPDFLESQKFFYENQPQQ
jgi:hypothetical protein